MKRHAPAILSLVVSGLAAIIFVSEGVVAAADPASALREARATKEAYAERFRRSGATDSALLVPVVRSLRETLEIAMPEAQHAEVLYELGAVLRLAGREDEAAPILQDAAARAETAGRSDVAFDAWIALTRIYAEDVNDHRVAGHAIDRAADVIGDSPSLKQRHDLAVYRAELLDNSGDIEAGLVAAAEAIESAQTPADRVHAYYKTGELFRKFGQRCQYQDFNSYDDCRKGLDAAAIAYNHAATIAEEHGWTAFAAQMRKSEQELDWWRFVLKRPEHEKKMIGDVTFTPKQLSEVIVTRNFDSAAMPLTQDHFSPELIERVVQESIAARGQTGARDLSMAASALELRNDPQGAAQVYTAAIELLEKERGSLFDVRRRGTVIEDRINLYHQAALRFLTLDDKEKAFAAFEKVRARGLAELSSLAEDGRISSPDLEWLSELLVVEAQLSDLQDSLVQKAIETGDLAGQGGTLESLRRLQRARRDLIRLNPDTARRLAEQGGALVSVHELETAAKAAGLPVLLYWSDQTNLIVWYVGPHGSEVRLVFLPQSVLREKVQKLRMSAERAQAGFDRETARQLYLYLIAPFAELLGPEQLIIVPQGDLVSLPFELLVDPESDRFLVERWAISYAPNATMAAKALARPVALPARVAAIYDQRIESATGEVGQLQAALDPERVDAVAMWDLDSGGLRQHLVAANGLHLLVHGTFSGVEPLLSTVDLDLADRDMARLYAADLIGLPLSHMVLAVLSACESGQADVRISNEIFGIPWALLVAGVDQVVLSRWRVNAAANGDWMKHFYRALGGGASPANAAAAAMRAMIAASDTAHPFFWAGLQVTGR